jgi:hypothetical protein
VDELLDVVTPAHEYQRAHPALLGRVYPTCITTAGLEADNLAAVERYDRFVCHALFLTHFSLCQK